MKFEEVKRHIDGIPFISPRNAAKLYDFIIDNPIKDVLELGIGYGTSSCFIAAALDEKNEGGKLTCVDLVEAEDFFKPSIKELLDKTNLGKNVEVIREKTGYTWFLHNEIERNSTDYVCTPKYDLCIIDGPKNWTIDGAAFFMADKLLKKNGWIIFDDYLWSYARADKAGKEATDGITHRKLSEAELNTPQIREVFQLLVMQHSNYNNFKIHGEGDWAWAQKTGEETNKKVNIEYDVNQTELFKKIRKNIREKKQVNH